jgi:hypothetical protein
VRHEDAGSIRVIEGDQLISAFGGFVLWLFGLAGLVGMALAVAMLFAARWPAAVWMRRRVGSAAESLELAAALAER